MTRRPLTVVACCLLLWCAACEDSDLETTTNHKSEALTSQIANAERKTELRVAYIYSVGIVISAVAIACGIALRRK